MRRRKVSRRRLGQHPQQLNRTTRHSIKADGRFHAWRHDHRLNIDLLRNHMLGFSSPLRYIVDVPHERGPTCRVAWRSASLFSVPCGRRFRSDLHARDCGRRSLTLLLRRARFLHRRSLNGMLPERRNRSRERLRKKPTIYWPSFSSGAENHFQVMSEDGIFRIENDGCRTVATASMTSIGRSQAGLAMLNASSSSGKPGRPITQVIITAVSSH